MSKRSIRRQQSEAMQGEAMRIARGTQRPGQTKQQTKLIAQGIHKGIEQYKKQQNARARELDKRLKRASQQSTAADNSETRVQERVVCKQHWLPWVLLIVTWLAMAGYYWLAR